jgi:hypothetical protein
MCVEFRCVVDAAVIEYCSIKAVFILAPFNKGAVVPVNYVHLIYEII